ncbi:MAG: heat-inducible transcriptional repressor HrcA [Elusimicrobiaceae bacterium]
MRILKPEIAVEREHCILRWIIQEFVRSRHPVGSELIAKKCGLGISSASVRSIMKKLEDEGYLAQSHTSGGRLPTDKAYRFYVDYLSEVRKLALEERRRIEGEYKRQMDEIDRVMAQTSKLLASISHSAGFVFSSGIASQSIARMDLLPLGRDYILVMIVTQSGSVKHWPVQTETEIPPERLRLMSVFLNEHLSGLPISEARRVLWDYLRSGQDDLRNAAELAGRFLQTIERQGPEETDLHIEGISQLAGLVDEKDFSGFFDMLNIMQEKRRFIDMLKNQLDSFVQDAVPAVRVSIGAENNLKELRQMSLVTRSYRVGDKCVGIVGILGPRHMEYSKAISLVTFMSSLMEDSISQWEKFMISKDGQF